jgi:hypothetical protein
MNKLIYGVFVTCMTSLIVSCVPSRTLPQAEFTRGYSAVKSGKVVKFGSEKVNIQKLTKSEQTSFSYPNGEAKSLTTTTGEIAFQYRNDGHLASFDIFEMKGDYTTAKESKKLKETGSRSNPIIQFALFYDKSGDFVIADAKLNLKNAVNSDFKGLANPDVMNKMGSTFGAAFQHWAHLSGAEVAVGDTDTSYKKLFSGLMRPLLGSGDFDKLDIDYDWSPRLAGVEGGIAIFICESSKNQCYVKGSLDNSISGHATCDAKYSISVEHGRLVAEQILCEATATMNGETAKIIYRSSTEAPIVR